ncbi:MAG: hypothetical protein M0Z42_00885 [Actinomycetota bacterium]|nr:hypothetical protein [Actinomycetota bacterium]
MPASLSPSRWARARQHGDGRGRVEHLELATLSWVHRFNEERLHGHCGDLPPAELQVAFSSAQ